MERTLLAWSGFLVYVVLTLWLAWQGMKRTRDLSSFALGNKDMGPLMVGITLATSVASTATFLINPGFVFTHGVSAMLHFGVSAVAGIVLALVVLSKGFRRLGDRYNALTLPHWIGARYQSGALRTYFALGMLGITVPFLVLILKGSAVMMQHTLGLPYAVSVVAIAVFVAAYILMGGTYALAFTNVVQGVLMLAIALIVFTSGLHLFGDGVGAFMAKLEAQDPNLTLVYNPASPLYYDGWTVFVAPFFVAMGLVCQPHILTKALMLKSERDVNKYLGYSTAIGVVFALVLFAGCYARLLYPELTKVPQDAVVVMYLQKQFPSVIGVLVSVIMLAAAVSTLDGFLLSASTIAGNDLVLGALGDRLFPGRSPEERQRLGLKVSRALLALLGTVTLAWAFAPPTLAGLVAQAGVYSLVAASLAPISMGIFLTRVHARDAFAAAVAGPALHLGLYLPGLVKNPALSGALGLALSFVVLLGATGLRRLLSRSDGTAASQQAA